MPINIQKRKVLARNSSICHEILRKGNFFSAPKSNHTHTHTQQSASQKQNDTQWSTYRIANQIKFI